MRVYHCDHCPNLLFFESSQCVSCGSALAFLPDLGIVASLDKGEDGIWTSPAESAVGKRYRLCQNYVEHNVCNWAVPADSPHERCDSCRLTSVIPDLEKEGSKETWYRIEVAKRRLLYGLAYLLCSPRNKTDDPETGLTFELRADPDNPEEPRVLTGHAEGVIVLNIAEANDAERERRRLALGEPYRTLLGHFRHEVGHYYWDELIARGDRIEEFRAVFGDESVDYGESLRKHYDQGPPPNWQENFVSSYASSHAWEDWAETWAHYLHMVDTLETAAHCGVSLRPRHKDMPSVKSIPHAASDARVTFDRMMESWFPLTYVLNNLNRGLGLADGYPFVLSEPVIEKLRFVHEVVSGGGKEKRRKAEVKAAAPA
jgi:hypothetical protein